MNIPPLHGIILFNQIVDRKPFALDDKRDRTYKSDRSYLQKCMHFQKVTRSIDQEQRTLYAVDVEV